MGRIAWCFLEHGGLRKGWMQAWSCIEYQCSKVPINERCCRKLGVYRYFYNPSLQKCQQVMVSDCCTPELLGAFLTMEECEKAGCNPGPSGAGEDEVPYIQPNLPVVPPTSQGAGEDEVPFIVQPKPTETPPASQGPDHAPSPQPPAFTLAYPPRPAIYPNNPNYDGGEYGLMEAQPWL